MHIAINENHYITASLLTENSVGDPSVLDDLMDQSGDFDVAMADGAYDGEPSYKKILDRNPTARIVIPPPKNAVIHTDKSPQRNNHVDIIQKNGRRAWDKTNNYGLRSLVELAMLRHKTIIGPKLKARGLAQQKTESNISARVLNKMTALGMPVSVLIA